MKKLLLLFFFSGSIDSFSQERSVFDSPRLNDHKVTLEVRPSIYNTPYREPDTLRAICLVTMCPNGIAHARMGYVVIAQGKRPVYLDCNKKALKLPQVGWGYELIDPNYKHR